MSNFCEHCGSKNEDNYSFCGSCGKPIEATSMPAPENLRTSKTLDRLKKNKTLLIVAALIIIAFVILFVRQQNDRSAKDAAEAPGKATQARYQKAVNCFNQAEAPGISTIVFNVLLWKDKRYASLENNHEGIQVSVSDYSSESVLITLVGHVVNDGGGRWWEQYAMSNGDGDCAKMLFPMNSGWGTPSSNDVGTRNASMDREGKIQLS
ncbi:MAG: DUF7577 domain-containing protein [Thermoleophilia bacterium]